MRAAIVAAVLAWAAPARADEVGELIKGAAPCDGKRAQCFGLAVHVPVVDGKPIGDLRSAWYAFTIPFNMTGHPAINIPFGQSKAGLPIGIHFVAPWFAEAELIALAQAFDAHTGASMLFPPGFAAA